MPGFPDFRRLSRSDKLVAAITAVSTLLFIILMLTPPPPGLAKFQIYLPLHSLMEIFAVIIAIMVFVVGWYNRHILNDRALTVLAIGFAAVAIFDFIHTFTVQNMPAFFAETYRGRGIVYWLAGRFTAAITLLGFVILSRRQASVQYCSWILAAVLSLVFVLIWFEMNYPHWLPVMLVPDNGLTPFKIYAEYFLFALYMLAAILLWQRRGTKHVVNTGWLAAAAWIMGVGELYFTLYHQVTDFYNVIGHVYKVIAYALLFWSIFLHVVREPYSRLRESQERLQISEARLQALVDSAMDAIIVVDDSHRIVMFNKAAENMFGYSAGEMTGKYVSALMPDRYRVEHQEHMKSFADEGLSARETRRFGQIVGLRADGSEFPAEAAVARINTPQGRYLSVTLHDVTSRHEHAKAIRLSEERYHILLKNLPGAVYRCELDVPWRVSFMSDGVLKLTGYSADRFMSPGEIEWASLVVPEDLDAVEHAVQAGIANQTQYDIRYRILHADESIRWVHERGQAFYDGDGVPLWLEGFILDVSEEVKAQDSLAHAYDDLEQRISARTAELADLNYLLNEAQHIAQMGSWELDLVSNQLDWSDEIYHIFELDQKQFGASYEAFLDAIHPDDRDMVNSAYTESVVRQIPYEVEHRLLMADGRIKNVRERGKTEYTAEGKALRSIGTVQDITAQVMTENRLRETSQLLDSIVENMPNMIFLKDARDLRFLLFNKAGEKLLGMPRHELIGKNDYDFFPQEQADFFTGKDRLVLEELGYLDIPEEEIDSTAHGKRILHTKKIALRNEQGAPKYLLGISEDITDAIHARKMLESSHRLLNAVVENAHVLIAVLDTDFNFIRVNANYAAADLKDPDYFIGKNHFDLYPNTENEAMFRKVVETGEAITIFARPFEYAYNRERGVTHWDWTLTPLKDETGKITSLVFSLLDVTPRINAIEELSRRERELRDINETLEQRVHDRTQELAIAYNFTDTILQTVRVLIVVLDRRGGIIRFNRTCEEVTGYKSEELLGKPLWDYLIPPEQLTAVKSVFAEPEASHFPNHYENEWVMRDGSRRRFAWSNTCLLDGHGEVDFVIATGVDVTDTRSAEQKLRMSEEMFRELTENIREVFFMRDTDTNKMLYVSLAYERLWGQSRDELLGDPLAFMKAVHPDDVETVRAAYQRQHIQQEYFNAEYRIVKPDGEMRWVWARTFPIYDETGAVYRIAGLVEDITERKLSEEMRLEQERAQRNTLVREVHHRIKNNLQGVIGLLRQHATREPLLQSPLDSAIAQLSTMAQVHGLQSKDHAQTTALCDLIEAIAHNVVGLTGVAVEPQVARQIPHPVPVAQDEAVPMALILNELIFNAVKHSDRETIVPIKITIEHQDNSVIVRIYNRANSSTLKVNFKANTGLGTGLSLVRALLPRQARMEIRQEAAMVITELKLFPPVVVLTGLQ